MESADVFPPLKSCLGGISDCHHQTLWRAFPLNSAPTPLTESSQQSKDIEDKLGDLIPWLAKLNERTTLTSIDGNHEEAERRAQLKGCVQHFRRLVDPSKPFVEPWKISRIDLKRC